MAETAGRARVPAPRALVARRRDGLLALATAAVVLAAHLASPVVTSYDSRWTIPTAASLAHRGDADLDEYAPLLRADGYYAVERVNGHLYDRYPIGASLLALPAVLALDAAARVLPVPNAERLIAERRAAALEVAVASGVVAATAALVFLIARECGRTPMGALVVAAIFAFCTPAWSTASRGLWQHGPSMLSLAAALYLLLRARSRPLCAALAAVPLGFAFVARPTNALPLVVLTAYVAWRHPRATPSYLVLLAAVLVPFVATNLARYGQPLSTYFDPANQPQAAAPGAALVAALGHLVSPSRGLLVFSPVLVLAGCGAIAKLRARTFDALDLAVVLILVLHLAVISFAGQWWAGHSYGPRFFTDVLPLFAYLLAFALPQVGLDGDAVPRRRRLARRAVFAVLAVWSFVLHYRGANDFEVWAWNGSPVDVDRDPARVWDWRDPQFLRGWTGG